MCSDLSILDGLICFILMYLCKCKMGIDILRGKKVKRYVKYSKIILIVDLYLVISGRMFHRCEWTCVRKSCLMWCLGKWNIDDF